MGQLYDLVGFSTSTVGTGTITVGTALSGHRTMAAAGIPDGTVVSYGLSSNNGAARETGQGTVGGGGTTLTRTLGASSTGALLNLSGLTEVYITGLAADFMDPAAWWASSASKTKLDGIQAGATANATDAQLRDRATHTGTQPAATITGLAAVATSGAYADLTGTPTIRPGADPLTAQVFG